MFTHAQARNRWRIKRQPISGQSGSFFFDDYLEFGDEYVDWKKFDAPNTVKLKWVDAGPREESPAEVYERGTLPQEYGFHLYQADGYP
ncbi:MAG: hypothetical protein R2727_11330 [Bacteroidales bacterium]